MPTYATLAAESWWTAEYEAPAHAAFNARLRTFYGHTRAQTGSKGDNNHLRGRHRSRNWCLYSAYCTNRSYGTTDARDKRGDGDWLRATDVGIQNATLRAASKRLDQAVRSGQLPAVAEWFGTIDGSTVVGWYQGQPSSSDDSHLWHLHVGLWTEHCDNAQQLQLLGDIITGDEMALSDKDAEALIWRVEALINDRTTVAGGPTEGTPNLLHQRLAELKAKVDGLAAPQVSVTIDQASFTPEVLAAIAKAVADEGHRRSAN